MTESQKAKKAYWFSEEGILLIQNAIQLGMAEKDIASTLIQIDPSSLRRWKAENPAFKRAIHTTKVMLEQKVINNLLRIATETDNVPAIKYYLNNRAPNRWSENGNLESDTPKEPIAITIVASPKPDKKRVEEMEKDILDGNRNSE